MIKTDAQIICRKEPYGVVCEWKGGRFAEASDEILAIFAQEQLKRRHQRGDVLSVGRLRIRIVALSLRSSQMNDSWLIRLESPRAQLYLLYREHAERLIRCVLNIEARIRGFMLKPVHGEIMPFTAKLADHLL